MPQTSKAPTTTDFIDFSTPEEWEAWLAQNYNRDEVWLRIAKKDSGKTSITIPQALDVALCYGWIDSHRKGYDTAYYLQRYSPRRAKSPWSLINVEKAEALIASGRMQAPGYAEIQLAKDDGRWAIAYESQRTAQVPAELLIALAHNHFAQQAFATLDKSAQYALFLPILKAITPKSRDLHVQKVIAKLDVDGRASASKHST